MTDIYADEADAREQTRLVQQTQGRALLEALGSIYTERLHRRSNDFNATRGLRLVIAKLQRTSFGQPVVSSSS